MKTNRKIFLVVLTLVCSIQFSAQPFDYNEGKYLLKRLHYENTGGEKGVSTFIYDAANNLYKGVWELLDSSRHSINYYTINNGRVVELNRYFSDNMTSEKTFVYNSKGLIISESFHRSDSVDGKADYEYDTNDKLVKQVCNKKNGWFTGELHYSYKNGHPNEAKIFRKGKQIGIVTYKYSDDGNLLQEFWDFTGDWTQTFNYEYIKKDCKSWTNSNPLLSLSNCYLIDKENYSFNNKTTGPSFYKYDKSGKLTEKTFVRSDGLKTRTTYEYNKVGTLISAIRHYNDNTEGIFNYQYNSNGQIIEKSFKKPDGTISSESFAYDIHGKLRLARYDNMDGWLTGNIIFELDRYDRVKSGRFESDEGTEALISFIYNKNDLVMQIQWSFSTGENQTYTFDYKQNTIKE